MRFMWWYCQIYIHWLYVRLCIQICFYLRIETNFPRLTIETCSTYITYIVLEGMPTLYIQVRTYVSKKWQYKLLSIYFFISEWCFPHINPWWYDIRTLHIMNNIHFRHRNGCSYESVKVFETENVSTWGGLEPPTFGFLPNALTYWAVRARHLLSTVLNTGSGGIDIFEVKLTFDMLTVRGQQHSFSAHERVFLWKCQSFWDRKCLDLRGTRTPNLRIHAECSILLSYQGQTFAVQRFEHWLCRYRYFLSKINIWYVNCARATAFIFGTRTGVLMNVSKFLRQKMSRPEGDSNPQSSEMIISVLCHRSMI